MTTTKLKTRLAWAIVASVMLAIGLIATTVALVNTSIELDKQRAILDMACHYSGDRTACKAGIKLIENLDTKDIKDLGR